MRHFMVSYDLQKLQTYTPVWDLLEGWGGVRLLESLWLVSIDRTAHQLRDALNDAVDTDDAVAVIELKSGAGWSTLRAKPAGHAWLAHRIAA